MADKDKKKADTKKEPEDFFLEDLEPEDAQTDVKGGRKAGKGQQEYL